MPAARLSLFRHEYFEQNGCDTVKITKWRSELNGCREAAFHLTELRSTIWMDWKWAMGE